MRLRPLALATAVVATSTASILGAGPASADHSWNGYHWARTSNPFTLKLGDNVGTAWDTTLRTASSDWSKSTVLDTTVVAGSVSPRTCRATAGMVQVCNAAYGQTGWLGIASVSANASHITAGTVKLNDTYFASSTYNTPAWRNLVTCQEVGHTFGLAHQDETFDNPNLGTCMDYTNSPSTNQHPNTHDYEELVTIYSHLDSSSTVGTGSTTAVPQAGATEASWGTRVEGSRAEGHSTYVRSVGHGQTVITSVTWAVS